MFWVFLDYAVYVCLHLQVPVLQRRVLHVILFPVLLQMKLSPKCCPMTQTRNHNHVALWPMNVRRAHCWSTRNKKVSQWWYWLELHKKCIVIAILISAIMKLQYIYWPVYIYIYSIYIYNDAVYVYTHTHTQSGASTYKFDSFPKSLRNLKFVSRDVFSMKMP